MAKKTKKLSPKQKLRALGKEIKATAKAFAKCEKLGTRLSEKAVALQAKHDKLSVKLNPNSPA